MDQIVHIWFVFQVVMLLHRDWSHQDNGDVLFWAATCEELVGPLKVLDGVKVNSEEYTSAQDRVLSTLEKSWSKDDAGVQEWQRTLTLLPRLAGLSGI